MSFANLRDDRKSRQSKSYVYADSLTSIVPVTKAAAPTAKGRTEEEKDSRKLERDGLYGSLPPFLDIRISAESGRGIFTTEKLTPGTVLISTRPHVSVLHTRYLDSYCSSCAGPTLKSSLKRCPSCHTVYYCDSVCQKSDWKIHKFECAALTKWANAAPSEEVSIPGEAIRGLGRIVWQRQKKGQTSAWAREIDAMQSHKSSAMSASAQEMVTMFAHSLVMYLGLDSPSRIAEFGLPSAGALVDLISRFIANTFALTSPSLTPLGVAVSPAVALINHSCDPNAVIVFPRSSQKSSVGEPLIQVIAIKDIAPTEEILTAYVDTILPKLARQVSLKETYDFDCACPLCTDQSATDPRVSLWCPKSCGGTCPYPKDESSIIRCTRCKTAVSSTDAILDALRLGQEALDKASSLEFRDPASARRLTSNMLPILVSAGLTPSSHPLLSMNRLHQSLLISDLSTTPTRESLDEVICAASKSYVGLSNILPIGHPVRAVAQAELGKLLAVDEPSSSHSDSQSEPKPLTGMPPFPPSGPARLKLAYDTLVEARQELLIGFGHANEGGGVGKEVREYLVSLEKELGVWKQGVRNVIEDTPKLK